MQFSDDEILWLHELDWSLPSTMEEPVRPAKRSRRLGQSLLVGLAYAGFAWIPSHAFMHVMRAGWKG